MSKAKLTKRERMVDQAVKALAKISAENKAIMSIETLRQINDRYIKLYDFKSLVEEEEGNKK
jgi:hypothetical protein